MKKLVLRFEDAKTRSDFVGWLLDAGGDQDFYSYQEMHDRTKVSAATPRGAKQWDWQTKGEEAEEHEIDMKRIEP